MSVMLQLDRHGRGKVDSRAMPGNEPPDPLTLFVIETLRAVRNALGSLADGTKGDAAKQALTAVDVAIEALGGTDAR